MTTRAHSRCGSIRRRASRHRRHQGHRLWIEQAEGAKCWLGVMSEQKAHGLHDVPIAVVDGLKGFPEAVEAVYPQATVQTCIVD